MTTTEPSRWTERSILTYGIAVVLVTGRILSDGRPLAVALRGRNTLVAGDPRSGKSWVTGLYSEQLILDGYCVCVIDPEGDYGALESLPGVMLFGGGRLPPRLDDLIRGLHQPDI